MFAFAIKPNENQSAVAAAGITGVRVQRARCSIDLLVDRGTREEYVEGEVVDEGEEAGAEQCVEGEVVYDEGEEVVVELVEG